MLLGAIRPTKTGTGWNTVTLHLQVSTMDCLTIEDETADRLSWNVGVVVVVVVLVVAAAVAVVK